MYPSAAPLSVVEAIVGPQQPRHYAHVGDLAAASAVAALPSVMNNAPALPPVDPLAELKAKVKAWGKQLDAKNWKAVRDEMRATMKGDAHA
ncbi:MAG TPA: hypothetical protein DCZ95_07125 [Verrucomicrobia bacterium]|nr:hypothetical protein [Verrucomicrobiota bacterium]